MKLMFARFAGRCAETGKTIIPGQEILYDPDQRKAYHRLSNKALEFYPMDECQFIAKETEEFYDRIVTKAQSGK